MGNKGSYLKDQQGKEEEQRREIDNITKRLEFHGKLVYSIVHSVNSQQANVEAILLNIRDKFHTGDEHGKSLHENETENRNDKLPQHCRTTNEDENRTVKLRLNCKITDSDGDVTNMFRHDPITNVDDKYRTLLCSIQNSLQCQSSALETSFEALIQCINGVLDIFRPENKQNTGSSVDQDYSRKWLLYRDSPKPAICDIHEALKREQIKNRHLEQHIKSVTEENDNISCKIKTLIEQDEHLSQENKKLLTEYEQLEREMVELKEKINELTSKDVSTEEYILKLKNENDSLKLQLKDEESRIQVQLLYQSRGELMSKVADRLKLLLADKLGIDRSKIQFIDCFSERDVNPDIPLCLVCINASRLGTDVGSAIQKLKGYVSTNVSVLIFHHKDVHALPSQLSDRVLTGPEFKTLGGIFDLAFLSEKGIYACEMNEIAADGIIKFLKANK